MDLKVTPAVTRLQQLVARDQLEAALPKDRAGADSTSTGSDASVTKSAVNKVTTTLSTQQRQQIAELQRIDAHVRAHEAAHIAAGAGVVTGGPSYSYTYGPDGKQYAVAGEVGIDTSPASKPQANIDKGQQIQRAALAPSDPSPQDYKVASVGGQLVQRGYTELAAEVAAAQAAEKAADLAQSEKQVELRQGARSSSPEIQDPITDADSVNQTGAVSPTQNFSRDILARTYAFDPAAGNEPRISLFA